MLYLREGTSRPGPERRDPRRARGGEGTQNPLVSLRGLTSMYSSSSRTRCLLVVARASPPARFLRGPDPAGTNSARVDASGVSIAIPGPLGRRRYVTGPEDGGGGTVPNAQALATVHQWETCALRGQTALRSDVTRSPDPNGSCSLRPAPAPLWSCESGLSAPGGAVVGQTKGRVVHVNREKF